MRIGPDLVIDCLRVEPLVTVPKGAYVTARYGFDEVYHIAIHLL